MIRRAASSFIAASVVRCSAAGSRPTPRRRRAPSRAGAEPGSVAPLVDRVKGAVVTIQSTKFIRRVRGRGSLDAGCCASSSGCRRRAPTREKQEALGSGFIVDQSGHHPDEQPRRRGRRRGDGQAGRQPPLRGARARQRSADRRRGGAHRATRPAICRRSRWATPTGCGSATTCSPSATRSASARP